MSQSALLTVFASSAATPASGLYAALFASLGATGVVMDTVAFPPLLSSGGAEAGNGDPVGYVPDAANSGYAFEQTTSGAKLTCVVTNGIPAVKYGAGKEMPTTPSLSFAQNSDATFIMVGRFAPNEQAPFGFLGSNPTFGYLYDLFTRVQLYAAGERRTTINGLTQNTPVIVRFRATSFPAVYIDSYLMDGTPLISGNSSIPHPIDYNAPFQIGYSALSPQSEIAFLLAADKLVDGDNWTAVLADLVSRYGGWYA